MYVATGATGATGATEGLLEMGSWFHFAPFDLNCGGDWRMCVVRKPVNEQHH